MTTKASIDRLHRALFRLSVAKNWLLSLSELKIDMLSSFLSLSFKLAQVTFCQAYSTLWFLMRIIFGKNQEFQIVAPLLAAR